jgi:hypothetical protein
MRRNNQKLMKVPFYFSVFAALALSGFSSCARVKVDPIEVKPIEINVNVRVTVQKELDDFFGDLDQKEKTIAH